MSKWRKIEVCNPDQWLAPAILGHSLHSYSEFIENFEDKAFGPNGELLNKLTMDLITERHLRNVMTAVVSHAVNIVMQKGVQQPRGGQWERETIQKLMSTIGGQQMAEQLTAPAHKLSAALAKNM
eukprot:3130222-Heterocapsa_arctica.AAC.1